MTEILKLPINNVYAKGDYTVTMYLGSEKAPVKLLLDTGSSTLVVKADSYQPENDKNLVASAIAQEVTYGIGGWSGPVIYSNINVHEHCPSSHSANNLATKPSVTLNHTPVALVSSTKQQQTFAEGDGILGLAYHHLNKGFNLTGYFTEHNISPAITYPWPFSPPDAEINNTASTTDKNLAPSSDDLKAFKHFLWQYPEHDITPYFTELAEHKLVANKFAFYSKRSSVYVNEQHKALNVANASKAQLAPLSQLPENQGFLIMGGGEEQTDLYQGDFQNVKVAHDVYYNVTLDSVQVADNAAIAAAPLEQSRLKSYFTNAIIDTGAAAIVLTAEIYQQVINDLVAVEPSFAALLSPFKDYNAQYTGIDASLIELEKWPTLYFTFIAEAKSDINNEADTGAGESSTNTSTNDHNNNSSNEKPLIKLACTPETYWQLNTPSYGKACFKLLSQLPQWPNQSIIGLPLLNNYYVVFDRSEDKTGVIKFALQQ